ncbi:MAG: hypothetical protein OXI33_04570 [Chloroflexota bacterium]|nr:hypothetical protein [Chloroflexota bacterium]
MQLGDLEVEYEGPASFLTADLIPLLQQVSVLHEQDEGPKPSGEATKKANGQKDPPSQSSTRLSVTTIATALDVDSGPDMVMAAAAYLSLSEGKEVFSRDDIRKTMREAPAYYKPSMTSNLTPYLRRLVKKDRIRQVAEKKYALAMAAREELSETLAGHQ